MKIPQMMSKEVGWGRGSGYLITQPHLYIANSQINTPQSIYFARFPTSLMKVRSKICTACKSILSLQEKL